MSFFQWTYRHHKSFIFAFVSFALFGILSIFYMPISLFPRVTFPRIVVSAEAGDRPADRMTVEVTRPLEEAIRSVLNVRDIRSTTSRGNTDISINFKWGTDMISAMLQVNAAISRVIEKLPAGTTFIVRRMDPTVFPVLGYSLTSNTVSPVKLRDVALYQIRPPLSTIQGVAKIGVLGGRKAEFQIIVIPSKLLAYGLTIKEIADAVSSYNILQAVGRMEENYKFYLVLSNNQVLNINDLKRIVIKKNSFGIIHLGDIAKVKMGTVPEWDRVTADGKNAVLFQVYQQPDGNTVQIARDVKIKLTQIKTLLPKDIRIRNWYDQSDLIIASASSARDALLIGITFAVIILLIFLRNFKITLIASIIVPMVLASTILLLKVLGMSLNIMTVGGMAAAVALIIDDGIVMIEHIIRRLRSSEDNLENRIKMAAKEFTRPIFGSSTSTIIIFAPLAFLSGVTGAFFKALSVTMALSLAISFLWAWIIIPIISVRFLSQKDTTGKDIGKILHFFHIIYEYLLKKFLKYPIFIICIVLAFLGIGYYAYHKVGSGFMPSMDEGGFILDYRAKSGTSLTETDRLLRQVESILRKRPEVRTFSRRTGLALGGFITEVNEGDFFVKLKPLPRRSLDSVIDDVRKRIKRNVPGLEIEISKLMEDLIGDLTDVPQPVEVKVFSDDENFLKKISVKITERIKKIQGMVDVKNGMILAGDSLSIKVNTLLSSAVGLTPKGITQNLYGYLNGLRASSVQIGPKMVGIRIWIPKNYRNSLYNIKNLPMGPIGNRSLPSQRFVEFKKIMGQPQITRENLKRMIAVYGRISGRDMGSTVKDVIRVLKRPNFFPKKTYFTMGGLYKQQQIAFHGLIIVFISAVFLVFTLLLYLYEDFKVAVAMMLSSLVAVAAVFIGLWLTRTDLNIMSMMGMIMIVGIVTEVAIFYYSEFNEISPTISFHKRLFFAGKNRMRPIVMTAFAAILALSPLALKIGQGADMLQPLAIAIISGLIVQIPLVLFFLPVILRILKKKEYNSDIQNNLF